MRITVTVVDLSNAWSADVLFDADPELPVSDLWSAWTTRPGVQHGGSW